MMNINDEMQELEGEDDDPSPIIRIFERLTFERGQEIHDQVSSMIELFSLGNVTLDMLDTLLECVKIIFVHPQTNKNPRILDFLVTLTHVTLLNYTSNKNLALVFDALIDVFSQTMVAADSQIRHTTFRLLNKVQTFIDLSRLSHVPDEFEQHLLDLLNHEPTLLVLDEILPIAAKFQRKNPQFIEAFLCRLNSPKWHTYLDRRLRIISLLEYSSSSLQFLISTIENDTDLSQLAFESLLDGERGFTLDTLGDQGRLIVFRVASTSRDLSRLIFTRWISQNGHELIDILRLCQVSSASTNRSNIETALKYFLHDENVRRVVLNNLKISIGTSKGGLLLSNVSNYSEQLFLWRLLCQFMNEEDDIHPDFHELIIYVYRLIKTSVDRTLSANEEFIIGQHASLLSTFDMLDTYRRKCIEAMGRCILVHFGEYESIIEQAFRLIQRIHSSIDTSQERYQLMTYTLNDIIQRCSNEQSEKLAFIQCMTIARVFIEHEKAFQLNNTDFKQLLHSLIKSGFSHTDSEIQSQTLATLSSLMCHSRQAAEEYIRQNLYIINKVENLSLKCKSVSTFIDVLLVHGLDILITVDRTPSEFTSQYLQDLFDDRNIEVKHLVVVGLMKLFLSSRLSPTVASLRLILDYRFSTDYRTILQSQRDEITSFFYFFTHLSHANVLLIEELTYDLIIRSLPFISDNSTIAYKAILTESMCHFCIELLSLPTLPVGNEDEHSHYHLAKNLLQSIHQSTNQRNSFVMKSYLNTIKLLQFQYMTKEQLQVLCNLIIQLRQYSNSPVVVSNAIRNIEEQIQSSLILIEKLTNGINVDKRPRSPSPSSSISTKRISLPFNPLVTSSPSVLRDRTNDLPASNDLQSSSVSSRGVKRKSNPHRYMTLDFENGTDDFL